VLQKARFITHIIVIVVLVVLFIFLFIIMKQIRRPWTCPARMMGPSRPLPPRSEPKHELALSRGSSTVLEHETASEAQEEGREDSTPLLSCCSW